MTKDKERSPNDQRSDAKNPNNEEYQKSMDNKSEQYNPDAETRSPNEQRADVKNPNNDEYKENQDNKANQLNPEHPAYHKSREEND